MAKMFDKLTQPSLKDMCQQALLTKILSGELKAGDWLPPERDLADQMGISRSSINQAVVQLAAMGFVQIVPRRGTMVCDYRKHPTPQSLAALMSYGSPELDHTLFGNLMDFRRMIECECARLACRNIYENTFEEMTACLDDLSSGSSDPSDELYRFHYHLTQASGNTIYSMLFRGFEPILRTLIARHYTLRGTDLQESIRMHRALLDAIRRKDEDAAVQLTRSILTQGIAVLETKYE